MTHKIYINAYFIISLHFSYPVNQVYLVMTFRRPSRSSNLVSRLAVVGVALLAILTDRNSHNKTKYLTDYDII